MDRALRVRVSGPLAAYSDGFRTVLRERGYTPASAAGQLQLMAQLSQWLVEAGSGGADLTSVAVERFLQARRAAGYRQWLSMRGMSPLLEYLRSEGIAPTPPTVGPLTPGEVLLAGYRDYLVSERGLAASTVRNYLDIARLFVSRRSTATGLRLGDLSAGEVGEFVLAESRCRSVGSATLVVVGLRALLRYLHQTGITRTELADAVVSAASWPGSSLPRPIDAGQAARLLRSCDRRTAVGRRDFAILTLLLRLGLRVGEVAALQRGDVDWRHGEILVRGKGRRQERLPLPADVGEAIAGWLRRSKPERCCPRVFTTLLAPRCPMSGKAVSAVVRRAARRAAMPEVTAHRLRHTAATELLRAGASLPEVGQVLRHTSILTTAIYAKVDHGALASVARPWPVSTR